VVIAGRALQGAGAISAAVMAMATDMTRAQHRTKAMAMMGGSIGLMFALSLVGAPWLYPLVGMDGLFALVGVLALAGIAVTLLVVPPEPSASHDPRREVRPAALLAVVLDLELLRLNVGIFILHVVQIAIFVVVPVALVSRAGLPLSEHWKVYLPVVLGSFALMVPPLLHAERRGRLKFLFLSAVVLLAAVELGLAVCFDNFPFLVGLLLFFFIAFNILEACLPSLVSRIAPASSRGTALGVYNTTQALGLAVGGSIGGWLAQHFGDRAVFVFGFAAVALWLLVASSMRVPVDAAEGVS
jgi:MFS family permease